MAITKAEPRASAWKFDFDVFRTQLSGGALAFAVAPIVAPEHLYAFLACGSICVICGIFAGSGTK